ncbi:MAG: helix-turn-helix domain-containing protein [Phycisphaerae bacterium]|nr:helix-turn-helix domain-containing protein [Phycisphaerae bacterium]
MRDALSPKQVARAIGVSEASLKRWCDKGLLPTIRTAGGHRRLPIAGVLEFLRTSQRGLLRPEVLGLPATCGKTEAVLERAMPRLRAALEAGDHERIRATILDMHLARHSLDEIGDRVVMPALAALRQGCESGVFEVYQERLATELCLRALHEVAQTLPTLPQAAPAALGATIAGDLDRVPITLIELILRQVGWQAQSLGPDIPAKSLAAALHGKRPRMFWLSVSRMRSVDEFLGEYQRVFDTAMEHDIALVVGGPALKDEIRRQMRYSAFCDNFSHLVTFARTLYHPGGEGEHSA